MCMYTVATGQNGMVFILKGTMSLLFHPCPHATDSTRPLQFLWASWVHVGGGGGALLKALKSGQDPWFNQWHTQKGVWGVPQKNFGFSGLKMHGFKFWDTLPNVFSRLMLPVVVAQSYCSFTPAVCAFLQAPPLQGRKLVIGWKPWEIRKALLDVVELWRKTFPPYPLCLSQKLPTVS